MIYQLIIIAVFTNLHMMTQTPIKSEKSVSKNGMTVTWTYYTERVSFSIEAPTNGWVAIGFNEKEELSDTYLIMGSMFQNKVRVVEHYILESGNYKPISDLGVSSTVTDIYGIESKGKTKISFSIPIQSQSKFRKDLSPGNTYSLLIAYSQEDDFMHHSRMRSSLQIEL